MRSVLFLILAFALVGCHKPDAPKNQDPPACCQKRNENSIKDLVPKGRWDEVKAELEKIGAKKLCCPDRLVTRNNQEIVFWEPPQWGNPPANYREIIQKQLDEFRKKNQYVIQLSHKGPLRQ